MRADPERMAVIVGVGQVEDRPVDPATGLDSFDLMVAALRAADREAASGWLTRAQSVAIVQQLSFPEINPLARRVADAIGSAARLAYESDGPNGDSPVLLLNEAANRIATGEITVAVVAGGEALRTAAQRAALAARTDVTEHNPLHRRAAHTPPGFRQRYGLAAPVDIYPLYENACRAAWGQTLAEGQAETGALWSGLSAVAARTPSAWLRTARTADEIVTPGPGNRPIAFPYTKLMVANASVNQGAAFIVTSLAEARRRGVPAERLIHVGRGAAAHEPTDVLARDRYDRSAGMTACLRRVLEWNEVGTGDVDLAELYSCFPCVPKLARRALDWPAERPATVFGGLTFGGGPIGNYMSHAVAEMVGALRRGEGRRGLLFGNGGYATRNHAIVLATTPLPGAGTAHAFSCQTDADAARGPVPELVKDYAGPATIETYTIFFDRAGDPRGGVIVARTADGRRTLARVSGEDAALIAFLTDGAAEPVGAAGRIVAAGDVMTWRA